MHLAIRALVALAALLAHGAPFAAQTSPGSLDQAIAHARSAMQVAMRDGAVPGATVAVVVDGELLWSEAFGEATRGTRFGIGSISKTLTLAAAMRLADEGRLDLDAPVERYLPDWPHRDRGITLRRLAVHQSGLSDEFANRHYASTVHFPDLDSAYRHIRNERLVYTPGTRSEYATGLFTIVGRVLERVAGESYPRLMHRLVFEPTGMRYTTPNDPRQPAASRARFYVTGAGGLEQAPSVDPSHKLPGAGFLATAEDLARFGAALLDTAFLSATARDVMFSPVPLADGTPTMYALGFRARNESRRRVLVQPGGGLGIASWLAVYPDDRVVVALLSNLTGAPLDSLPLVIAAPFLTRGPA